MSEDQVPSPAQVAKSEAAKQAVILAFGVITVLVFMAIMHPDSMRTLRMRSAAASSRLLGSLSREVGRISMKIELTTGRQEYGLPYHLSLARDWARTMYTRSSDAS